ncbi:MAG: Do family serine endopeptidase [Hyphomicrobiaceae bacterium]
MNRFLPTSTAIAGLALAVTGLVQPAQAQKPGPQTIAPIAQRLTPAVVNISTSHTVKGTSGTPLPRVPKGSPFEEFFKDFFNSGSAGGQRPERKVSSLGSGFVIDGKAGLIVTNVHVIEGADEIVANFSDGSKLKVDKVVGRDSKTDLAVLKVTPKKPLPSVKFGSSEQIKVGDWVMAIGNPFGLGGTVTVGIISAKARDINTGPYDDYLQTDAAINKGNSGGPLFNMDGDVVGVNTAIISPTGGSIGIGFAVPADTAVKVIDQLSRFGEVRRGWLGVNVSSVTEELAKELGVEEGVGAHVASVSPNSPAEKGGIETGDVITKFDGHAISTMRGLPRVVAETPVGKNVAVEFLRKGKKQQTSISVGRLAEDDTGAPVDSQAGERRLMGLKLSELTDELKRKYLLKDTTKGVVVTEVDETGPAKDLGLKPGDVIVEVQDEPVTKLSEIAERIEKVRKSGRRQILLRVENAKGEVRSIALPFQ